MGKRSDFARIDKDYYRTFDKRAGKAIEPFLSPSTRFCEPCAGAGDLMDQLTAMGHVCARARDIEPQREDIEQKDALTTLTGNIDCFITNPPWSRDILHPLIEFLSSQHPTWLLFDADWSHTIQASPYMAYCAKIVSVGRLIWIPGTKMSGKDNCAWYLFDRSWQKPTEFYPRQRRLNLIL